MTTDPPPDPAPDVLLRRLSKRTPAASRYKLEGEVARGGMGAIIKVWDEDLRRHLAMKVVLNEDEAASAGAATTVDGKQLARFVEEAQVTGQLDHPGIVPVHELGLDSEGRVFFTMKLVQGRNLKHIFTLVFEDQEKWNETRALGVLLKVCEAMSYAHAKGVIHRDLKPANVMVGSFGEVYVMDWGLSRALGRKDTHDIRIQPEFTMSIRSVKTERRDERERTPDSPIVTMDGDVMGTPAYMPPEQARGEIENLSPRSDVYAIGAMLYHLLAREVPYVPKGVRMSGHTILASVIKGPPRPLSSIAPKTPGELVAICEKAMAREASDRYPDTLALAEDLRAFLEQRVVSAYETGTWAETKKWVQRNKPLAASVVAAVVLLVAGLSASLVFKGQSDNNAALASHRADETAEQARIAKASEARANDKEREATQKAEDVLSLSAIQDLKDLAAGADTLWPAGPEMLPNYESWLSRARLLVEGQAADPAKGLRRRPSLVEHEAKLQEIRQRAASLTPEQVEANRRSSPSYEELERQKDALRFLTQAAGDPKLASNEIKSQVQLLKDRVAVLEREVAEYRPHYDFQDDNDHWWHDQLQQLVSDLRGFTNEAKGGLYSSGISVAHGWGVLKREGFARAIEERSVSGVEAKGRWNKAIAAIAASSKYDRVSLQPQMGLLPIGEDPDSGLLEFADLQTGAAAERGTDKKLVLTLETGLVFVLIPGGTFWMGAQKQDKNGRNYDPRADSNEGPPHEVTLPPYFLSKYEMTQGQWQRCTGQNPSDFGPSHYDKSWNRAGKGWSSLHPVERVSWDDCDQVLGRLGLTLPSEAEWEFAARAGESTPWWTGSDLDSLKGAANVADAYGESHGVDWWSESEWDKGFDDGNSFSAEVGSYRPNGFGLHDVHGNVSEWCRNAFEPYGPTKRKAPQVSGAVPRMRRGGSFDNPASDARSARRFVNAQANSFNMVGVRPARPL